MSETVRSSCGQKRIENRIRFGRIAEQHIIDRQRRVVSFTAGSIFAFVRWTANDTAPSCPHRHPARGRAGDYATVPCAPRRESAAHFRVAEGRKVLQAIDAIEALGIDPADAAPDTGSTSTIACQSASSRDPTRRPGIKPGCIGRTDT
jgi:hypothetical protein